MKMMKIFVITIILSIFCTMTGFAGIWELTDLGYKYKNDDGT